MQGRVLYANFAKARLWRFELCQGCQGKIEKKSPLLEPGPDHNVATGQVGSTHSLARLDPAQGRALPGETSIPNLTGADAKNAEITEIQRPKEKKKNESAQLFSCSVHPE